MTQGKFEVTEQTRLRRYHDRASYDKETIYDILDATPLCHIGFMRDGKPAIIPTLQWREGDHVYWHGSSKSKALLYSNNSEICMSVTLLDGLVMARSAVHHSVNHRSVIIYGTPTIIEDPEVKTEKLKNMIDKLYPERWEHLRPIQPIEVKATAVLSMPIERVSAKTRTGMPSDDEEDYELPIWAGVLPVVQQIMPAESDPRNLEGVEAPEHLNSIKIG